MNAKIKKLEEKKEDLEKKNILLMISDLKYQEKIIEVDDIHKYYVIIDKNLRI